MGPVWVTRCQMAPFSYSALRRALPKRTIRERERERDLALWLSLFLHLWAVF